MFAKLSCCLWSHRNRTSVKRKHVFNASRCFHTLLLLVVTTTPPSRHEQESRFGTERKSRSASNWKTVGEAIEANIYSISCSLFAVYSQTVLKNS